MRAGLFELDHHLQLRSSWIYSFSEFPGTASFCLIFLAMSFKVLRALGCDRETVVQFGPEFPTKLLRRNARVELHGLLHAVSALFFGPVEGLVSGAHPGSCVLDVCIKAPGYAKAQGDRNEPTRAFEWLGGDRCT